MEGPQILLVQSRHMKDVDARQHVDRDDLPGHLAERNPGGRRGCAWNFRSKTRPAAKLVLSLSALAVMA